MIYKAAVIGLGAIGAEIDANHCYAYKEYDKTKLVSVCDLELNKIHKAADKYLTEGCKSYTDFEKMLKTENIDILSICTHDHYSILKEAIKYPIKAIWCEKPIANNLKEANDMVNLCKKKGIHLHINHYRRYDPKAQALTLFLDKSTRASFYYSGGIYRTGSHMFDLLNRLFGEAVDMVGKFKEETSDPTVDGMVWFKNGMSCSIQSLGSAYPIFELDILTPKGMVSIINNEFDVEYQLPDSTVNTSKKTIFISAVNNIVRCIEKKAKPLSSGNDGLAALEMIELFIQSARNNKKKRKIKL